MRLSSVSSWTAKQVSQWIGGLDDALVQYGDKVRENEISGTKLLAISRQDLEKLEVVKVGHQELFLESIQLLHKLPKEEKTEESLKTLVSSFTENVRSALNKVKEAPDSREEEGPLPEDVLQALPPVTSAAKGLVTLLSRYPYSVVKRCNQLREKICKKAELITKQAEKNSQLVEKELSEKLNALNEDCEEFLSGAEEKVIFQCFTVATALLNTEGHTAGLGLSFSTGADHLHIVSGIHAQSPASLSEKIDIGDEILQISEQVVVGWQQHKVAELLKSQPNSFPIMVKKLPGGHCTELSAELTVNGIHDPKQTIESHEPQTLSDHKDEQVPEQKEPVHDGDAAGRETVQNEEQTEKQAGEKLHHLSPEDSNVVATEEHKEQSHEESKEDTIVITKEETKEESKEESKEVTVELTKEESKDETKEITVEVIKEESREIKIEVTKEESKEIKIEVTKEESKETVVETKEQTREICKIETRLESEVVESVPETGKEEAVVTEDTSVPGHKEEPAVECGGSDETTDKEKGGEDEPAAEEQKAPAVAVVVDVKDVKEKVKETEVKEADTKETEEPTSPVRRTRSFDEEKAAETPLSSTTWYVDTDGEPLEEAEGYSTTIVGGVPHTIAISSGNSPKLTSMSPKKKSKQETPVHHQGKFKLAWGSLFGKKKSKSPATSPERTATDSGDGREETQGTVEASPEEKEPSEPPSETKEEGKTETVPVETLTVVAAVNVEATDTEKENLEEPAIVEKQQEVEQSPVEPEETPTSVEEATKPSAETTAVEAATTPKQSEEPDEQVEKAVDQAEEPDKLAAELSKPAEESAKPDEEPVKLAEESAKPAEEPVKPAEESTKSAEEPAQPPEEPTKLVEEPAKPPEEPTKPAEEPAKPVEELAKPAEEPTKPAEEPTKSGEEGEPTTVEQRSADSTSPEKHEKEPHQSKFKKVWGSLFKGKRSKSIDKANPDSKDEKGERSESPEAAGDKGEVTEQPTSTEDGSKPASAEPEVVVSTTEVPPESAPVPPSEEKADEAATKTEAPSPPEEAEEKKEEAAEQQANAAPEAQETTEKTTVPEVQDPSKESTESPAEKVEEVAEKEGTPKAAVELIEEAPSNEPQEPLATVAEERVATESPKSRSTPASPPLSDGEATPDEDSVLRERIARQNDSPAAGSHSPKAPPRMNMKISYAEKTKEGTLEVEVHGEVVKRSEDEKKKRGPAENRISCVELGEADHKGWLTKKSSGGLLAHWSWKRKWMVLKDQKLYYYKTSFDAVAGGVIHLDGAEIALAPEIKKPLCFKVEHSQIKTGKMYFIADTQDELDLWFKVLNTSSKGEPIIKPSPSNIVRLDVGHDHRRRSGSTGIRPKRVGSVLGVGAANQNYHDEKADEGKERPRRASHGSEPQDTSRLARTDSQGKNREPEASLEGTAEQDPNLPVVIVELPSSPKSEPETSEAAEKLAAQAEMQVKTIAEEKEEIVEEKKEVISLKEQKAEDEVPSGEKEEGAVSPMQGEPLQEKNEEAALEPAVSAGEATTSETTPDNTEPASSAKAEESAQPESPAAVEVTSETTHSVVERTEAGEADPNTVTEPEAPAAIAETPVAIAETPVAIAETPVAIAETPVAEPAPSPAEPSEVKAPSESSTVASDDVTRTDLQSEEGAEDKEKEEEAVDELISQGVKRHSISSWKEKYPHLSGYVEGTEEENPQEQPQSDGADDQAPRPDKIDGQEPQPETIDGQEPQPDKIDGQEPQPETIDGQAPQPEKIDGQAPQPEKIDGQAPQPEKVDCQVPEAEDVQGKAPQPEKVDGQAPQADDVGGQAPQADDVGGQAPQADDVDGQAPQQAQVTDLNTQDTHL